MGDMWYDICWIAIEIQRVTVWPDAHMLPVFFRVSP